MDTSWSCVTTDMYWFV